MKRLFKKDKVIKFLSNEFVMLLVVFLIQYPFYLLIVLTVAFLVAASPHTAVLVVTIIMWCCLLIFSPITPTMYSIYTKSLDNWKNNMTFFSAFRLGIKQHFCRHMGYARTIQHHPAPSVFVDIDAKCSDCGLKSFEIDKRASDNYYYEIACSVLSRQNMEKFPDYYTNFFKQSQETSKGEQDEKSVH